MIRDFNDNWTFRRAGERAVPVTLPHDAMLTEKRRASCRNGVNSGYFPGGKYLYKKTFPWAEEDAGKSAVLHFEGVYQNCTVCVNGRQAGSHRYGYTAFDIDLSDHIRPGENTVAVSVDNSLEPNCRWYSGAGIYRPVTLLVREKESIKTVQIQTVSYDPSVIEVEMDGDTVEVWDGDRRIASGAPGVLALPGAKLWSAERPNLYTCVVKTAADERAVSFGIRKLEWSAQTGLLVNGKRVLLRGGCTHHDHGVLGAAEYREAEERRIRILKENGFNAVRIAHNPASQITLDVCDRLGMYVMNEAFDGWYTPKTYHDYARWFETDWRADLSAMVESSRNHPCVILYSVGNEVSETASKKGVRVCKMLADHVRGMDDTRPVTAGINVLLNVYAQMGLGIYRDKGDYQPEPLPEKTGCREKKTGSAFFNAVTQKLGGLMFFMSGGKRGDRASRGAAEGLDVLGLNYASSRYDPDAARYPGRMMVGSETMAADLPYNWARVKKYPQLIGDFVWSAWDYLGETCMGWTYRSYPGLPLLANQGMIDITGKPLASMGFLQVVWGLRKEPYLAVRPLNHAKEAPCKGSWQFTDAIDSWNWQGYEGVRTVVEVYADAAAVRLVLNGKTVGTKKVKEYKAIFRLPYVLGTLEAQALDAFGKIVSRHSLTTGGGETVLSVRPEKTRVRAGEIFYVPVEFTDSQGALKPFVERRVELAAENARLLGFGSALYQTDEVFCQPYHNTYRGRALAVLRAGAPGRATITAQSGTLAGHAQVEVSE